MINNIINTKPTSLCNCSAKYRSSKLMNTRIVDPNEMHENNPNNVRCEASRHFGNKRVYLRDNINKLAINSKKNIRDLYRGINKFKRGYQLTSNLVKDKNGDLLEGPHNILNR
jgi:hypothetical protein